MNQNKKPTQKRKSQRGKSDFQWKKYLPNSDLHLSCLGRADENAIRCEVLLTEREMKSLGTKTVPRPTVMFQLCDVLAILKNGTFVGSVSRGIVSGRLDREQGLIHLILAPSSLQKEKEVTQAMLLEHVVRWKITVEDMVYAKAFARLLRECDSQDRALKEGTSQEKPASKPVLTAKPAKKIIQTGILRPAETSRSTPEPAKKVAAKQSKVGAKPAPKKEHASSSQATPREEPAGSMGTLADVLGSQLEATKKIVAEQKKVAAKSVPDVKAPKPNPKALTSRLSEGSVRSTRDGMFRLEQDRKAKEAEAKREASQEQEEALVDEMQTTTKTPEVEVAHEESPSINARQARMYLATLKKNGGDLNALNVKNPVNLRFIRNAALKAKVPLKESETLVN